MPNKVGTKVVVKEFTQDDDDKPRKGPNGTVRQESFQEMNPETEAVERCCPCVRTIRHKMWFKCFVFLLVFSLDAVDLVCDWWLFKDVIMTEEGLVYGPPEQYITWGLLAFSILGTFTFIFEVVNLWWEVFRQNPWIDSDLASAITIWVEDVPQIVFNVLIVICREEAISYLQLVKASVMIAGIIIRIIVSFVRYCSKENLKKTKEKTKWAKQHITFRVFIMFGLIIIFAGSVVIFLCTQFERNLDGELKFNIPHTLFEGKYDDQRYFDNVSMYFNHPYIDFNTEPNWLRLITLYDVREKKTELFKIEYDQASQKKFMIWQTGNSGTLDPKECYTIDRTAKSLTKSSSCAANFINGNKVKFIFKFNFIPTSIPNLIFGDIEFNSKVDEPGKTCHNPDISIVNDIKRRKDAGTTHPVIHYYRTQSSVTQTYHTVSDATGTRFFQEKDLIDITTVWKTGFAGCESSGSLAPHLNADIDIDCTA